MNNIDFVIIITTCQKNLDKFIERKNKIINDIHKYPMRFYYFMGNPELSLEYEIDEDNNIITVKSSSI